MFAELVNPFMVTCGLFFLMSMLIIYHARTKDWGWKWGVFWIGALAFFFPAYLFVITALFEKSSDVRMGEHFVDNASEVTDWRVSRWLPESATIIEYHRYRSGHVAKFTSTEEEIVTWLNKLKAEGQPFLAEEIVGQETGSFGDNIINEAFKEYGWQDRETESIKQYEGIRTEDGAGFALYINTKRNIVYLQAGYW